MAGLTQAANYGTIKRYGEEINQIQYEIAPTRFTQVHCNETQAFKKWQEKYNNILDILDNGFVIFKEGAFEASKLKFR